MTFFLPAKSFLQSPEWEELQKKAGRKTWRAGGLLLIQHLLPRGLNYLYCPRPDQTTGVFFDEIKKIAGKEKSVFLKIDPVEKFSIFNFQFSISSPLQPQKTVRVDLGKPEEILLGEMREKTRYNMRLAARRGVTIKGAGFDLFWKLLNETANRDRFHLHEKNYYEKLLGTNSPDFSNELFFAEFEGKILASALINFYRPSKTATYLHGASSRKNKEVMAPHLLHWEIMKEAKARGFKCYDFWGIDEKKWPGLTRFKLGFGGEIFTYPDSLDIIFRPSYYKLYKLIKFLRSYR